MAGTIVEVAGFLGTTAGALQAFLQAKEVFLDPLKVRPLVNVEEIRDALNEAIRVSGSIRMDFEDEVEKSKTRVPSRIYMEWLHRVMEIEGQVRDVIAQSNEKKWFWFISGRQDFREDMKKMHEKVIQLCQESKEIRDKMLVDRAPERVVKRKGPDISKYEALRKPLEEILECLKRPKVKVIGIHGTVGIGKTTVMLNLNNHDRVAQMFDIVIWLPVSKEGSKENLGREHLQLSIAQRLKLTIAGTSNANDVAVRIATELKRKKYLLLLDDVKTYPDFDEIGIPLSNNGSKVVLTTRLSHVSRNKMVNKVIKVAYLLEHEAWTMFRDVLGREELIKDVKIGPVAWQVCRECRGVPLLIEKVANTFRLKHDESLWSDGLNSWRMWPSQECKGMREMYELLRFCYNDLGDDRYKICFLYGALYPEDSDINKDSLLECWGAEDLLGYRNDARKVRVMTGDLILTHLMNVSLLEEGKSDYYVTMDKFIRQVALYILEENPECDHLVETNKELSKPPDEETWRKKRRISLGDNKLDELPQSPNCSTLSTLFLQKNLGLTTIPPAFFKRMRKLRVLDFSHTGITSLPSSLSVLTILKVLHLNNCEQLVELPSHIMKLVQLESLDIHGSGITYIPPHIDKLIFLKRLWVSLGNGNDTTDVSFNYDMISKLSGLEELVIEVISPQQWNEVVEHIMKEVAKLQKFKRLKVCISNRIIDVIEVAPMTVRIRVPEARILLSYIRRTWWKEVRRIGAFRIFIGCENSEYNQNPEFVRYEKYFKYCNGADSKTPILEVLKEAEAFELVNHKDIKQLSDFGTANMDRIRGCLIEGCDAIEAIMDTVGSELLPNLEQLFMKDLPMLKSIWKEGPLQPGSLCKLTTVVISSCRTLVKIFPPGAIQQLHEIQYLTIEKCNEVEEIIPKADAGVILPKLEELTLLGMKKLRSICANESLEWPSLEKLKIFECRGLCKLPFKKGNVANLRRIEVEGKWWGALQNQEDKKELEKLCNFGMTQQCSSMKKRRSEQAFEN
ncbi:hypothetical protein Vadar_023970 [Vaccinium darrowii]|uniref:Uncharacterized protein n=1 Tax=Vaccinium darrowii TaxID=229202 RepID=A0ACB7X3Z4_9ERIC|nr:hypothetical protein Vadar_023970 [Vaccinium darrowii]